jgi:hypothetical protein
LFWLTPEASRQVRRGDQETKMRRFAVALAVGMMCLVNTARANDFAASIEKAKEALAESPSAAATSDPKDETVPPLMKLASTPSGFPTGRIALSALYAGFVAFQAYDVYSTNKAISNGANELNPQLRGLVHNPAAFIGLKVAVTAGSIVQTERLWRSQHKVAALALIAASNGIMMAVAAHNASVLNQQAIVR